MTKNINKQRETEQIPDQERQIYKYRGNTIKTLQELRFSAGKTTRSISNAILCGVRVAASTLQRMKQYNLIERIENFGWRITSHGIEVLEILFNSNNNNYVNTSTTTSKHDENTNDEIIQKIPPEEIPNCFYRASCHIRRILKQNIFNTKTAKQCSDKACQCIHYDSSESLKKSITIRNQLLSLETKGKVLVR